jgi:hypothetical protein
VQEGADAALRRAQRLGRTGTARLESVLPDRPAARPLLALAERLWRRDR